MFDQKQSNSLGESGFIPLEILSAKGASAVPTARRSLLLTGFIPTSNLKSYCVSSAKAERGFTLIELILVIFVSSILLIGLLGLYSWHSRVYSYQQAVIGVTEQSRLGGNSLKTYASKAELVLASATVDGVDFVSTTTSVILLLPVTDSGGEVISGANDLALFYLSGKDFFFKLKPHASSSRLSLLKLLSDSVNTLTLGYDNADFNFVESINIDMEALKQSQDGTIVKSRLQENIKLRNYDD